MARIGRVRRLRRGEVLSWEGTSVATLLASPALPAGTYSSMAPKMTHFAYMTGETILQLSTIGPWTITYVHPEDDPRKKAK